MSLLRFLVASGCRVVLYSFTNHPDCPWDADAISKFKTAFPDVSLMLDRRSRWLHLLTKVKKYLTGVVPGLSPQLVALSVRGLAPVYLELRRLHPDAIYLINYANGLLELNGAVADSSIIETHDLDFVQFSKRFGFALTSHRIMEKFRSEISLLQCAGGLIAIAPAEAGLFRLLFPQRHIFYVPDYGGELPRLEDRRSAGFQYDMLFVGSENPFNAEGISAFIRQNVELFERYTLAVAGRVCTVPDVISAAALSDHVHLLGFVDSLDELYRDSKLVVSPVDGTGLKIKVIEALAAGKPVLGSRHSIDGLPAGSERCVIAFTTENVVRFLEDDNLLAKASEAARLYAESLHSSGDLAALRDHLGQLGAISTGEAEASDSSHSPAWKGPPPVVK